jgi:hypothetical protein
MGLMLRDLTDATRASAPKSRLRPALLYGWPLQTGPAAAGETPQRLVPLELRGIDAMAGPLLRPGDWSIGNGGPGFDSTEDSMTVVDAPRRRGQSRRRGPGACAVSAAWSAGREA